MLTYSVLCAHCFPTLSEIVSIFSRQRCEKKERKHKSGIMNFMYGRTLNSQREIACAAEAEADWLIDRLTTNNNAMQSQGTVL